MKHKPTTDFFFPEQYYPQQSKRPVIVYYKKASVPWLKYAVWFVGCLAVYNLLTL